MKLLADANVEEPIVQRLRAQGHDVLYIREIDRKALDPAVLALARREERLLVSNDKDFGELIFLQRQAPAGVIFLRLPTYRAWAKAERLLAVLATGLQFDGYFTVVRPKAIRRRPFPSLS